MNEPILERGVPSVDYVVKFPLTDHNFHNVGLAGGLIEPLESRLVEHLKTLLRKGNRRVKDLQDRALDFVKEGECGVIEKITMVVGFIQIEKRYET